MANVLAVLLSILLVLVFLGWRIRAVFRTIRRVHRAEGVGDKLDAVARHFPNDPVDEAISRAGSERPAQQSLTRLTFRTTPGLLVLIAIAFFNVLNISFFQPELMPDDKLFPGLEAEAILWIKLSLVGLVVYTLVFHLVNTVTIDGAELVTTGWLFQRRYFDSTKLTKISLRHHGTYVLRFSDGKTARILKYVTGHDEMVQAFESAIAANQESTCRSFPKSKRSAVG